MASAPSTHVLPWLLVGDKKLARDRPALHAHKVRYILNATVPRADGGVANFFEQTDGALEYQRLPLRDANTEDILAHLPAATEFLERARVRADGAVLVHCNEGKSRSVAIVCAYLITTHGLTLADAMALVRSARPGAMPKEAFMRAFGGLEPRATVSADEAAAAAAAAAARPPKRGAEDDGDGGARKRPIGPAIGPARPTAAASADPAGDDEARAPSIGPSIGPSAGPGDSPTSAEPSFVGPPSIPIGPNRPPDATAS